MSKVKKSDGWKGCEANSNYSAYLFSFVGFGPTGGLGGDWFLFDTTPANTAKPSSGPVHRKMSQFKVPLSLLSCFLRQKLACFKAIIWGAQKERVQ